MARGILYQIEAESPCQEDIITADNVAMQLDEGIEWFSATKNLKTEFEVFSKMTGAKVGEKDTEAGNNGYVFTIPKEAKEAYFAKKYAAFREVSDKLTAENFCDPHTAYRLRTLIEDTYSNAIFSTDDYFRTLDDWMRCMEPDTPYWFCAAVVMH